MSSQRLTTISSGSEAQSGLRLKIESDAGSLEKELRKRIAGEVRFDNTSRAIYATDASNYRQVPIGVVVPKTIEDVIETIAACRKFAAPVLSRGGGTSLAGQCCNTAVVIDWSKYLNRILELNAERSYARVQPGTICDDVVNAGRPYQLTYAPDPATHNHCCFGGMIGNNSCGAHAQMNGPAANNVEALEILLYDGTRMNVGWLSEQEWEQRSKGHGREAEIYAQLKSLRQRYQFVIEQRYPKIIRRISGYNLDQLIPNEKGMINLARALVGSEGTCVTILEATVTLIYNQPERVIVVLGYEDVYQAADHLIEVLKFKPVALEAIDDRLCQFIRKKGGRHAQHLSVLPEGNGWLMVEFGAPTRDEARNTARALVDEVSRSSNPPHCRILDDQQQQKNLWDVREAGLGSTAFVPGQRDTWPGWEDSAVAPEKLGGYLRDLRKLF